MLFKELCRIASLIRDSLSLSSQSSSTLIHCPFVCFCKPSAAHLYTSAPLKLESSPHVVRSAFAVDELSSTGVREEAVNGKKEAETMLKSCIRKTQGDEAGRKRVQWMDYTGKELAEIKEFEFSETGDTDNEEDSSRCLCAIL